MRMIVCFCLLLTATAGSLPAQQGSWSAGIEGGPGLSLIYAGNSLYTHAKPALAGAAGIFGEYGFARHFSARLALQYERISTRTDNYIPLYSPDGKLQYSLDYLSLPILVKWSSAGRIGFFVNAGPCLSLLLRETLWYVPGNGSKEKVANETDAYRPFDLAVTVGGGMAIPLGDRFMVTLELRDNLGVINIRTSATDFEHGLYSSGAKMKGFTNSALLLAGLSYRFGAAQGLPCTPNDPEFQYIKK